MPQFQLAFILAILCAAVLALTGCRPYIEEFESPLRRVAAGVMFLGILTLAVFLPVASYGDVRFVDMDLLTVPDMLVGHVILVMFLLVWWRLRGDVSLAGFLHLSGNNLRSKLTQGVLVGCNGWLLTILVMVSVATLFGSAHDAAAVEAIPDVMPWIAKLPFLSKLAIVITAMTVEEAFFRGFLQPRVGWIPSSLLFALGHFSYGMPFMIVGVLTISLVIGRVFAQHNDLLPCVIAHGVFDAIQIFVVLPYSVKMLEQVVALPA